MNHELELSVIFRLLTVEEVLNYHSRMREEVGIGEPLSLPGAMSDAGMAFDTGSFHEPRFFGRDGAHRAPADALATAVA